MIKTAMLMLALSTPAHKAPDYTPVPKVEQVRTFCTTNCYQPAPTGRRTCITTCY